MGEEKLLEQIRADYKTTEKWILDYYEKRQEYYRESRYIHDKSFNISVGAERGYSNYNNFQVIHFAELDHTEKWLLAIELAALTLSPKKKIFIEQRRRAEKKNQCLRIQGNGRINWITFVQKHYAINMMKKYGGAMENYWISEGTIKIWWKEFVELTRLIAMKKDCIF